MKKVTIERILPSIHGTFGTLSVDGYQFFTLEEELKGNAVGQSAIPNGVYPLRRTTYFRYGYPTYEVADVPGRSRILIHPGNTEEDTQGCILLGLTLGFLVVDRDEEDGKANKKLAVLKSRAAFEKFMALMEGVDTATIEIRWYGE